MIANQSRKNIVLDLESAPPTLMIENLFNMDIKGDSDY